MCKIVTFTDVKKLNLKQHVNNIGNMLLKLEEDGFGYAVQGKLGVFGEKTIAPKFKTRIASSGVVSLPIVKRRYSMFGQPSELSGPGMFHGRTSTNSGGLLNTHPMQRPDDTGTWHLVHNGVVTDKGPAYSKLTQNDSEDVLFRLMDGGIDAVQTYLEGYYAFAAIDPTGRLHICRDGYATLFIAWSAIYDTFIIATTESLLFKLNKMLGAKIGPIDEIEEDTYMIFQGNDLVHSEFIKPLGFTRKQAVLSTASLGRTLPSQSTANLGNEQYGHHRPTNDDTRWASEAQWDTTLDVISGCHLSSDAMNEGQGYADLVDDDEAVYYEYKNEVDNMDASYLIVDSMDNIIKLYEFYKLDYIAQEQCTITRADGTMLELDERLKSSVRRLA